jgi:hypothetical protein
LDRVYLFVIFSFALTLRLIYLLQIDPYRSFTTLPVTPELTMSGRNKFPQASGLAPGSFIKRRSIPIS